MFSLFKKLFSRAGLTPDAAPVVGKAAPVPAPAPARSPMASAPLAYASAPKTAPRAPAPAAAPKPPPNQINGTIELPLIDILSHLPNDLSAQVLSRPNGMFTLSASEVVEQLRTGAVRIPLALLRKGSPPGTFMENAAHDDSLIDLPLPLILTAIGPAGLARRPDQQRRTVPDEVTGVFGSAHRHFTQTGDKPASAGAPTSTRAAPTLILADAPKTATPVLPKSVTPVAPKAFTSISAKPFTPVGPSLPAHKPANSSLPGQTALKMPASPQIPLATPKPSSPLPFVAQRPAISLVVEAVRPPTDETVRVGMESVSEPWPEAVQQELAQLNLGSAAMWIPVSRLEPGVKTGRVVFTLAELCGWISPPVPPPAHGESQVELPLKVIAPLFLAKHRATSPRAMVSVGEEVPDLFSAGLIQLAAATPATAPAAAAPAPAKPGEADVWGGVFQQPVNSELNPQEMAQKILSLPGVAGALLASNDGLLVAGQVPAPLRAETMAAFLPRIFTHAGLCAGEVQLGTLRVLRLSLDPAPCVVFKAGTLYLAVLGQAGQPLPEAALEQLAGQLS
jgi:predicted regulator of Ras-like GTPase activity (Roadblock/LC7/MglB family)